MKKYIKLIRVKHYIKNLLIFLPIIFSKRITQTDDLIKTIIAFTIFCLATSIVYIFNDIIDAENDKNHPKKKNRPLATGEVSKKSAIITILFILLIFCIMIGIFLKDNLYALTIVLAYIIINLFYSVKLKNVAIVDVTVLAIGFLIRVIFGALVIQIEISNWLYLTILSLSFYLGMGKRRNELINLSNNNTRKVLKKYSENFLNENMYMFSTLSIIFYSLWTLEMSKEYDNIIYTIPLIIIILLKYSLNIERESDGDPVDVILGDKTLICLAVLLAIILGIVIY